jgi:hypothetical protein
VASVIADCAVGQPAEARASTNPASTSVSKSARSSSHWRPAITQVAYQARANPCLLNSGRCGSSSFVYGVRPGARFGSPVRPRKRPGPGRHCASPARCPVRPRAPARGWRPSPMWLGRLDEVRANGSGRGRPGRVSGRPQRANGLASPD